jgi:hypothetical protein
VRALLGFLNRLAQDFRTGLLLIHHLRKSMGGARPAEVSLDDFRGSSHIMAIARSVLGLSVVQTGPCLDRNGPRRLELIKTNLGAYPPPLGVEFLPLEPAGVALRWGGEPRAYHPPTRLDRCKEWLLAVLAEAPDGLRPAEVVAAGAGDGYERGLIYRAREALGGRIENTAGRQHPRNRWKLAGGPRPQPLP